MLPFLASKWAFSHFIHRRKYQFCKRVNTSQWCKRQKLYRGVTWFHNWLWILNFCLFVYLRHVFPNFAYDAFSNHDSANCSEVRAVKWSVIRLRKLWFAILVNFTPILWTHWIMQEFLNYSLTVKYSFLMTSQRIGYTSSISLQLYFIHYDQSQQTFLSPFGLKQGQSWLVSYYKCYDRYLQYIHCSDMFCLYIFKWPWLHVLSIYFQITLITCVVYIFSNDPN